MASIQSFSEQQNAQLAGAQVGQLIFIQKFNLPAQSESDDEQDEDFDEYAGKSGDEEDESDGEDKSRSQDGEPGSSEQEDAEGESDEDDADITDDTSLEDVATFRPTMYIITEISKDEADIVTDLRITQLAYDTQVGEAHTYQIYGTQCQSHHSTSCGADCKDAKSIKDVADSEGFSFSISPHGDIIRRHIATNPTRQCIANCSRGFLDDINSVSGMIKNYYAATLSWNGALPGFLQPPLCPVCMGQDLLKEQQDLQLNLLNGGQINAYTLFGDIHEYHQTLARRWAALGIPYKQFDEREWGHHFDDMISDEDGDYDNDGRRFEHWEEAMDPSNNAPLRPASDAVIAELPRKLFKEVTDSLETTTCMICKDGLEDETVMVELPCGHVEFCEECVVKWLKNYDNCPKCRAKVPSVGGEEAAGNPQATAGASAPAPIRRHVGGDDRYSSINGMGVSGDDAIAAAIAASMASVPAQQSQPEAEPEAPPELEMDGEDAVMSDY